MTISRVIQVGDPQLSTEVSNRLMSVHGHYVQAINHPTVAKGEERLRLAPTPFHTKPMMDQFVRDLSVIWKEVGVDRFHMRQALGASGKPCSLEQQKLTSGFPGSNFQPRFVTTARV